MRKYVFCILLLLLLISCQSTPQQAESPTPEPTPTPTATVTPTPTETVTSAGFHAPEGLELDVGDGKHKFWIEITEREELEGEESGTPILVSIYEESSGELKQSFEDKVQLSFDGVAPYAQDVNFDGYADLGYRSWAGGSYAGSAYWVWDPKAEEFIRDPYGLEDLAMPDFDPEKQIIETWNHSGCSYTIEFYRYLDGKLTCVRRLENRDNNSDDFTATLTVENYDEKTGTLKEVYREENAEIGGVTYASTEEFQRWHDLDYHGE